MLYFPFPPGGGLTTPKRIVVPGVEVGVDRLGAVELPGL
jgi:hypothetical protein